MTRKVWFTDVDSPVGPLRLAADEAGLRGIDFLAGASTKRPPADWVEAAGPLRPVVEQLQAYFAGTLRDFEVTLAPEGTAFQQKVWHRLREIPYGRTISYGELAALIGNPKAARAVGLANGQNPIPIVIPCHRVIGKGGSLVGYGGGLAIKEKLLGLEGIHLK